MSFIVFVILISISKQFRSDVASYPTQVHLSRGDMLIMLDSLHAEINRVGVRQFLVRLRYV